MAQEQDQEQEPQDAKASPQIVITFTEHASSNVDIQMQDIDTIQLWGAARMLEQIATEAWQQLRMQQARAQMQAAVDSGPQDHKPKRRGN